MSVGDELIRKSIGDSCACVVTVVLKKCLGSVVESCLTSILGHDIQINAQYKRFVQTDIKDIEHPVRSGDSVLNTTTNMPLAVHKEEGGQNS